MSNPGAAPLTVADSIGTVPLALFLAYRPNELYSTLLTDNNNNSLEMPMKVEEEANNYGIESAEATASEALSSLNKAKSKVESL
eukprot:scaffold2335_cov135-Skeletonema_menzelii.AAC.6